MFWNSVNDWNDRERAIARVKHYGPGLQYAPENLKGDREVVLAAVQKYGPALRFASDAVRGDREVVLAAVKSFGGALEYAAEELKRDREVVLAAVNHHGSELQYAPENLKGDREVVLAAVKRGGGAFKYASDRLRKDREVVLAAVKQDGKALKGASEWFNDDREIVLEALQNDKYDEEYETFVGHPGVYVPYPALKYASEKLRGDFKLALTAVRYNPNAHDFVSEQLEHDPIVNAVLRNDGDLALNELHRLAESVAETEEERERVNERISEIAKWFPSLALQALAASTKFESPLEADGVTHTAIHKRDREAFENGE